MRIFSVFSEDYRTCQKLLLQAQLFCLLVLVLSGEVIGRSSSRNTGSEEVETTSGGGGGLHLLLRPEARVLQQAEQWCVAKEGEANSALQGALDWTCGPLEGQGQVDCSPIQSTGICYLPNTLQDHSSWAFNEYYQQHLNGADSCDFGGNAVITTTNPSTATCTYSGTGVSGNSSSGSFNGSTGGSDNSNANFIRLQPSFQIAVVVAITYLLSGQAF
ncbi:unnamed protein product [Sphagnum jensenii]|uniref:X8 domain-containing protein n=1 Tax=Sphagnum jensenii TaxID=128206 RepID=A0ABP1AB59_9BRYO